MKKYKHLIVTLYVKFFLKSCLERNLHFHILAGLIFILKYITQEMNEF